MSVEAFLCHVGYILQVFTLDLMAVIYSLDLQEINNVILQETHVTLRLSKRRTEVEIVICDQLNFFGSRYPYTNISEFFRGASSQIIGQTLLLVVILYIQFTNSLIYLNLLCGLHFI